MLRREFVVLAIALAVSVGAAAGCSEDEGQARLTDAKAEIGCNATRGIKVVPADRGIYLSAYVNTVGLDGDPGAAEVHRPQIGQFSRAAGRRLALSYVLAPLLDGKFEFPTAQARAVWKSGAVPLISLLPISDWNVLTRQTADPMFTMQRFIDGEFDAGLTRWAEGPGEAGSR